MEKGKRNIHDIRKELKKFVCLTDDENQREEFIKLLFGKHINSGDLVLILSTVGLVNRR